MLCLIKMSMIGTAVIGAGILGAGATIYGANKAADAATSAAKTASDTSLSMYNQTNTNLAPYRAIGGTAELSRRSGGRSRGI